MKWRSVLLATLLAMVVGIGAIMPNGVQQAEAAVQQGQGVYRLELARWNVSADGTRPVETTDGINAALQWAKREGYHTFLVPKGTYLIAKGTSSIDPRGRINMVSGMTLELEDGAVLRKEQNNLETYSLIYLGSTVSDAVIRGGALVGDRDTHDYTARQTGGTHEWGYGINVAGAERILIEDIEISGFTGDGIMLGLDIRYGTYLQGRDFEAGGLDEKGQAAAAAGKIRSKNRAVTHFDHEIYRELRNFYMWVPQGVTGNSFDVYFYRADGTFISRQIGVPYWRGEVTVPAGADYFRVVVSAKSTSGVSMYRYTLDNAKQITVRNTEIHHNRRQGITVGGAFDVSIENNYIHDIRGIAPQSGIDVEQGYGINGRVAIRNNTFENNPYHVILYDGAQALVEGNQFGPNAIGLVVQEAFTEALVKNNVFDGASVNAKHTAMFKDNELNRTAALFTGPNIIIDGVTGTDASLNLSARDPFGIQVSNVDLTFSGRTQSGIFIENKPIALKNVKLTGPSAARSFSGNVENGSRFDNLQIIGYNPRLGMDLPRGMYTACRFEAGAGEGSGSVSVNKAGSFSFDDCTFKGGANVMRVDHPEADVTINGSTFGLVSAQTYSLGIIQIQSADTFVFTNNTVDVRGRGGKDVQLLTIGRTGWQSKPVNVAEAIITDNTFFASYPVNAISTTGGGSAAKAYRVENNELNGTKVNLRSVDAAAENR